MATPANSSRDIGRVRSSITWGWTVTPGVAAGITATLMPSAPCEPGVRASTRSRSAESPWITKSLTPLKLKPPARLSSSTVTPSQGGRPSGPIRAQPMRCPLRPIATRGDEWRGERAGGEEGRCDQPPALLLLQDAEFHPAEARATILLWYREPRPAELAHGAPELRVVAAGLIESGAQLCAAGAFAQHGAGALTDQLLFLAMGKLHARAPPRASRRGVLSTSDRPSLPRYRPCRCPDRR